MTTACLILARALHFGACLAFFGLLAFDRFIAVPLVSAELPAASDQWSRHVSRVSRAALMVVLLSGLAWFALVAVTMSGLPLVQALKPRTLATVWRRTDFGALWRIRGFVWLAAAAAVAVEDFAPWERARGGARWAQLLGGAVLLGSLAWVGHGRDGPPWHLTADTAHLLVAGCWPTGLLPLGLAIRQLRHEQAEPAWRAMRRLVRRFSVVSLLSVTLLAVTGWLNAAALVGPPSNFVRSTYGRWLLLKLVFFALAAAVGAVNLLHVKPQFAPDEAAGRPALELQRNVQWELILSTGIIVVVAILGILPPAVR